MKILILCTGNSCRSQMAHGFLQSFDDRLVVCSAGTEPAKQVNRKAVQVMEEEGIDISHHTPKPVDQYLKDEWDYVITVCDNANETCPFFMGKVKNRLHMGFEDPSRATGSEDFIMSEFRRVRDLIKADFRDFYIKNLKQLMKAEELKLVVKEKYGKIALENSSENSCCSSSSCCGTGVDYTVFSEKYDNKEGYHPEADMNLGCGIPTDFAQIKAGDHILDLGSGAGNDCFVARALVGDSGKVTGLDMTEPMIAKARENCTKLKFTNVDFVLGDIEEMPFDNKIFDVVISNCVLNLVPDKTKAFNEIFRVLKPGGHFCVSDVVIKGKLSERMLKDAEMYAGCVSGASEMTEYLKIVKDAGFLNIIVHKQKEIKLPDSLLAEYNDANELTSYQKGDTGIFSITVSASRP